MSDICKCEGTGCPMSSSCYRFTTEANPYRQSYFMEVPLKWSGLTQQGSHTPIVVECEEYWEWPKKINEE